MASLFDRDDVVFNVLVNDEGQYSLWPDYKEIPQGWHRTEKSGFKKECLEYIEAVWRDLRPLSLRRSIDAQP